MWSSKQIFLLFHSSKTVHNEEEKTETKFFRENLIGERGEKACK